MSTLLATVDLPVTDHTVRDARVLVLDLADSWDAATCRVDLALLIDELSSDVVANAGGEHDLRLELSLHEDLLYVSLADGSAIRPAVVDALAGRLRLLTTLAARWGHEPYQNGHRVWFELGPAPAPPRGDLDGEVPPAVMDHLRRLLDGPARRSRRPRWFRARRRR